MRLLDDPSIHRHKASSLLLRSPTHRDTFLLSDCFFLFHCFFFSFLLTFHICCTFVSSSIVVVLSTNIKLGVQKRGLASPSKIARDEVTMGIGSAKIQDDEPRSPLSSNHGSNACSSPLMNGNQVHARLQNS